MNNIPSNFSLDEACKYADVPEQVRTLIWQAVDRIVELERLYIRIRREVELEQEEVGIRDRYIETVLEGTKTTTKHKDLVKIIKEGFKDSGIEI